MLKALSPKYDRDVITATINIILVSSKVIPKE
jgi:hypothetical protein